jgi:hypothetical protein
MEELEIKDDQLLHLVSLLTHSLTRSSHFNSLSLKILTFSDCDNIGDANKWRHELISEITKKISEIKNASIGEHRIREVNDEINKLMKTKYHWYTHLTYFSRSLTYMNTHSGIKG